MVQAPSALSHISTLAREVARRLAENPSPEHVALAADTLERMADVYERASGVLFAPEPAVTTDIDLDELEDAGLV